MFSTILGLGIVYVMYTQMNNMNDVERLTEKLRNLEKAKQAAPKR